MVARHGSVCLILNATVRACVCVCAGYPISAHNGEHLCAFLGSSIDDEKCEKENGTEIN